MRIIISPAEKMNVDTDTFACQGLPVFIEKAETLKEYIKSLSYEEVKKLWGCNDKLAKLNYQRFQEMDLKKGLTPALISYEGIQYQYMAPEVFSEKEWAYVQEHLRILSGFYGALKPLDGVTPYRLEMQAKAALEGCSNLYAFWGRAIVFGSDGRGSPDFESRIERVFQSSGKIFDGSGSDDYVCIWRVEGWKDCAEGHTGEDGKG